MPFQIACGGCWMCNRGLHTQCETTQVRETGMGAALFGYSRLYGAVDGAQAEYLRVPHADFGPIKVPEGPPDDRFLFLSDVLPTAWQAVEYADVPPDGTLLVLGLRAAGRRDHRPPRRRRRGGGGPRPYVRPGRRLRGRRGRHGGPRVAGGGTVSLSGVYGGQSDPMPMLTLFDKQVTLRMGQANVHRWAPDILPLLEESDPLGTESFATHHLSLEDAPTAYADFQSKSQGTVKVVFRP